MVNMRTVPQLGYSACLTSVDNRRRVTRDDFLILPLLLCKTGYVVDKRRRH